MTCEEFDDAWTRRLDGGPARSTADVRAARLVHLDDCPRCREVDARYLALERAIGRWAAPPRPLPIETERLAAALATVRPMANRRNRAVSRALAAAAVVAAFVLLPRRPAPTPEAPVLVFEPPDASLPTALADAGLATWRLARETSAPAAKLGAAFLDWSDRAESRPAASPDETRSSGSTELLKSVGRQVNDGVVPLRSSALKAFDFLVAPAGAVESDRPGRGA